MTTPRKTFHDCLLSHRPANEARRSSMPRNFCTSTIAGPKRYGEPAAGAGDVRGGHHFGIGKTGEDGGDFRPQRE